MKRLRLNSAQKRMLTKLETELDCDAFITGGTVRDGLLGHEPLDNDFVVFGVRVEAVDALRGAIPVDSPGLKGMKLTLVDGHEVAVAPVGHTLLDEALRRDFTVNSLFVGLDEVVRDPTGVGLTDLANGVLEPSSTETFLDSRDRPFRAAAFMARLGFTASPMLDAIVKDFPAVPATEQVWRILKKMLDQSSEENLVKALRWMHQNEMLYMMMPEVDALHGVPQDPEWHPEGDVLEHVIQVTGAAVGVVQRLAGLTHDLGKESTTEFIDGHWRSRGHDKAGADPERHLLKRLGVPKDIRVKVAALRDEHMNIPTTKRGVRRLTDRLGRAGLTINDWFSFVWADRAGRTAPGKLPLAPDMSDAQVALDIALWLKLLNGGPEVLVQGRDLVALGVKPGKIFGKLLGQVREAQLDGEVETREQALSVLASLVSKESVR